VPGGVSPKDTQVQGAVEEEQDTSPATVHEPCPRCSGQRSGDDRYCEACGHDFFASPPAAAEWEAVATTDRAQFERLAVAGLSFPAEYVERRFELRDEEVRIGRSRGRADEPPPEIDLSGALEDPGISRLHAVLERQDDGTYAIRDLGSTNGTTLNDDPKRVGTTQAVPLSEGDHICVGAWTTITLQKR
jgi:FHA domain